MLMLHPVLCQYVDTLYVMYTEEKNKENKYSFLVWTGVGERAIVWISVTSTS